MKMHRHHAFTLVELLVVIAVITILCALIFPAVSSAKSKARRTVCLNHLREIALGIRMYADDSSDASPSPGSAAAQTNYLSLFSAYKELMKSYVGVNGTSRPNKMFTCPADNYYPSFVLPGGTNVFYVRQSLHEHPVFDYSSYAFNGGDNVTRILGPDKVVVDSPGLTGLKLSSVNQPARTLLVTEASALAPWSWHKPVWPDLRTEAMTYNNALNMVAYVDGHVSYIRIYWNRELFFAKGASFAMSYDPPAGYDYKWKGN